MSFPSQPLDAAGPHPRAPEDEPIPGYRLIEPLGRGGFGEVWKCEAPGGLFKAIKFVQAGGAFRDETSFVEQEYQALQCVKAIRHPFLLSMERVELHGGDLVIVTELADKSLQDVFDEYRQAGHPGIPRDELLDYLLEAAEALDLLNHAHGLQHLDVKGRNLFLVSNHIKVADFGLVSSLQDKRAGPDATASQLCRLGGLTPLYSSPEAMQRKISEKSDQYSLAVVYQELLTGTLPFNGKNARQLMMKHLTEPPDLAALPEEDRPIVAQALAKKPEDRFASCLEFVQTLLLGADEMHQFSAAVGPDRLRSSSALRRTAVFRKAPPAPRPAVPDHAQTQPPPADTVSLSDFHYLTCLEREPHRELWRVRAAGGERLAHLLRGFALTDQDQQAQVLTRLRALRHDALVPFDVAQNDVNRIVLLTDPPEATLRDRLIRCQAAHKSGVPREELLDALGQAAAALDALRERHSLYHLGLNPGNVLPGRGGARLAELGWLQLLWLPGSQPLAELNPRYAAPELAENRPAPSSDQYSLAMLFAEMLTGHHPLRSVGVRRAGAARGRPVADLSLLPAREREILERALHRDPQRRFGRCAELIDALRGPVKAAVRPAVGPADLEQTPAVPAEPVRPTRTHTAAGIYVPQPTWREAVSNLVQATAHDLVLQEHNAFRYVLDPHAGLEHVCGARLLPGVAELKLDGFRQQWDAQLKRTGVDSYHLFVAGKRSVWQACLGKRLGLEIELTLRSPQRTAGGHTQISLRMRPVGCTTEQGERLLHELGPALVESLRGYLLATPELRVQQRWPCQQTLQFRHRINVREHAPIACTARNISPRGIGLVTPFEPRAERFYLSVPNPEGAELVVPARVMRVRACGDGWFEVGAVFLDDPRGLVP